MYPIKDFSFKVKNYKSIGEEAQGFEEVYPINIIIGRNNSGKSALLDLVNYVLHPRDDFFENGHKEKNPEVQFSKKVLPTEFDTACNNAFTGHSPHTHNVKNILKRYIDKKLVVKILPGNKQEFVSIEDAIDPHFSSIQNSLSTALTSPLRGKMYKRLYADRDILPEPDDNQQPTLHFKGTECTKVIHHFLNKAELNSFRGDDKLLRALNEIFNPDSTFKNISVKKLFKSDKWEVHLDEESKGNIALSNSGSGFKTILLVLVNLLLIPKLSNKSLSDYVFAFEELENNLHPALQRRLLLYIRKKAVEEKCCFFITTHSNVIIDLFSKDKEAQIMHVTHNSDHAIAKKVTTYFDNKGILDDLDIRASDLLQSNVIVWVEGPSDRLYFNRWIELYSDGKIKEGAHYQCIFYGGRLLSHLTAEAENSINVSMLKINRNAIVLIDSDKKKASDSINQTKERIISEISSIGGISWVTKGKEIENYIPKEALCKLFSNDNLPALEIHEKISMYLDKNIANGEGEKFLKNKVFFTERILPFLTKENIKKAHDLGQQIKLVHDKICEWNKIG
jgi:putative ATP-dependent endonuclease of OLD family